MPARILRDVLVIDRSALAQNMYQLLFSAQSRYRVRFGEEFESLFKRSKRLKPDLLIINSNSIPRGNALRFPVPTILIASRDRMDIKEEMTGSKEVVLIEKPFYPFDLLSVASRLVTEGKAPQKRPHKGSSGRPRGRPRKNRG